MSKNVVAWTANGAPISVAALRLVVPMTLGAVANLSVDRRQSMQLALEAADSSAPKAMTTLGWVVSFVRALFGLELSTPQSSDPWKTKLLLASHAVNDAVSLDLAAEYQTASHKWNTILCSPLKQQPNEAPAEFLNQMGIDPLEVSMEVASIDDLRALDDFVQGILADGWCADAPTLNPEQPKITEFPLIEDLEASQACRMLVQIKTISRIAETLETQLKDHLRGCMDAGDVVVEASGTVRMGRPRRRIRLLDVDLIPSALVAQKRVPNRSAIWAVYEAEGKTPPGVEIFESKAPVTVTFENESQGSGAPIDG